MSARAHICLQQLLRKFQLCKSLSVKTVALHGANVRFVGCRADFELFLVFIEVFQAVEGMGADEGVAVGDVLLPASGLPFAVLLGKVLSVELPEGDCLGVVLMPAIKLVDTLLVLVLFV